MQFFMSYQMSYERIQHVLIMNWMYYNLFLNQFFLGSMYLYLFVYIYNICFTLKNYDNLAIATTCEVCHILNSSFSVQCIIAFQRRPSFSESFIKLCKDFLQEWHSKTNKRKHSLKLHNERKLEHVWVPLIHPC